LDFVAALAAKLEQYKEELDKASVKTIVVGCGESKNIKSYKEKANLVHGELVVDPDRQLYNALHLKVCKSTGELMSGKDSPYVKTGMISGLAWSLKEFVSTTGLGDVYQQGGDFVFQSNGSIAFQHLHDNPRDHSNIEEVFQAAGIKLNAKY